MFSSVELSESVTYQRTNQQTHCTEVGSRDANASKNAKQLNTKQLNSKQLNAKQLNSKQLNAKQLNTKQLNASKNAKQLNEKITALWSTPRQQCFIFSCD